MLAKLKITLIRSLIRFFSMLPLPVIQWLAERIGTCVWYMKGASVLTTQKNIALCFPHLDKQAQQQLAKKSLVETIKTVLEMGKAWLAPVASTLGYIQRVREEVDVEQAMAKGQGVIAIAPHLGNWEVLNLYIGDRFPLNVLYQPPDMAELDDFIRVARARQGTRMFPTNARGISGLLKALREGEMVGVLPDMEPPTSSGVFAPLFGINALSMTLVSKLLQKTRATVVCVYAKRLPEGKGFEVVFKAADPEIYSPDIETSVAALNRSVQACVEDSVEQYQWEYKRFKHKPGGKTRYYKF